MTREQALSQVAPNLSYFNDCKAPFAVSECKSWINKIFDDFEAQIKAKDDEIELLKSIVEEAMKPKTCEGCSNLFFDEIEKVYKCSNDVSDDVGYLHGEAVIRNIKDFHCVQHQPKDNE